MLAKLTADPDLLLVLALAATAAWCGLLYGLCGRWCTNSELAAGAVLVWTLLALLTSLRLPNGSYLFVWPALLGGLGLLVSRWARNRPGAQSYSARCYAGLCSLPFGGILLLAPPAALIWIALPPALPALTALAALTFWPLLTAVAATACEPGGTR